VSLGNPRELQQSLDGSRVRDIALLLKGHEISVKISHQGRVRKSEIEQQLKSGRDREPFRVLISKRHFQVDLRLAIIKCESQGPVSVGVIDMNGLKAINDTFGHGAGDEAIRSYLLAVAGVLETKGEAYRGDGGDEVFLVIPTLAFSEATQLAKAILRQINNERLAQWPDVRLSASFGLAWTEDPAHSPDDLSRNADELMYRAKKASKDTSTSRLALQGAEEIEVIGQDI